MLRGWDRPAIGGWEGVGGSPAEGCYVPLWREAGLQGRMGCRTRERNGKGATGRKMEAACEGVRWRRAKSEVRAARW